MKLSGVIFDLNGTVLKDDVFWTSAYESVLHGVGVKNIVGASHTCGLTVHRNWEILVDKYHIKTDKNVADLSSKTVSEYMKHLSEVSLNDGFEDLVTQFSDSGVPVGLATSSHWDMVEETFDSLGIESYFDFVTTSEEIKNSKPSPEIYELAADKMGVDPSECLVFEDSPAGVEAALAAGMKVIGVYKNEKNKKELSEANARVEDFTKVTPEMLADL